MPAGQPKTAREPSYRLHRPSGQARVIIDRKHHYLGRFESPESWDRYKALIDEWRTRKDVSRLTITIDELALRYTAHADEYYRRADGSPTGAAKNVRLAIRPVVHMFGPTRAAEFGPLKLKAVRERLIDSDHARTHINWQIHAVRSMFRWGLENELVPASVLESLRAVAPLKRGRSQARESPPVVAVPEGIVEATLPHLPRTVQAMVRLQLLTGARPGEISGMRPCEVTLGTDGVWTFRPSSHKTAYRGKDRRIFIGPQGQEVLRPFLDRDSQQYCFRPVDAEAERSAARRLARKTKVTPSQAGRTANANRKRPPGERYWKDSYNKAIARACRAAGVEPWSPNQLRHSRATLLRKLFGIEAARLVLGHSDPGVTLVYAERDFDAAARIQREIG